MSSRTDMPPELGGPRRHLFLSPHYDDIPLSAGATVRLLADHGMTPETLIVFGSEPDRAQPLSPFAESLHRKWGLGADEVIARRQAEEHAAAAILGARTSVLPFRDAIYRRDLYLSDDDLFGTPATAESALPAAIVAALPLAERARSDTRLYAPLGIGRHVDHQLVFQAGLDLANAGWDVWFYEDIPYALKPGARDSRLSEIEPRTGIAPVAQIPAAAGWERKIDAILRYPSQLETVFLQYVGVGASREEISAALRNYAVHVGAGVAAERFWQIPAKRVRTGC